MLPAFAILAEQGDRNVYVGGILLAQFKGQAAAARLDGDHLVAHHQAALEGDQCRGADAEGVGDENLRRIARLVSIPVGGEAQALVGHVRPGGRARPANPDEHLGGGAVVPHGQHIGAGGGRGERQARLAIQAGGKVAAGHVSVHGGENRRGHEVGVGDVLPQPGDLLEEGGQRLVAGRVAIPIHRQDLVAAGLPGLARPGIRADAHVDIGRAGVSHGAPADRQAALVG